MSDHNDHMQVGSRELKTRLGSYLRQVKEGATLIVTERGRPIAELRPLTLGDSLEERLHQMVASGLVSHEVREPQPLAHWEPIVPAPGTAPVSLAISEGRADRL
jgi:prevent-host-death family protein